MNILNNPVGKYLGDQKVTEVKVSGKTTPLGAEIVEIMTEDGKIKLFPTQIAERLLTDKPTDATNFRDARIKPIIEKLMDVVTELDMRMDDWEYISAIMQGSLRQSYLKAEEILWQTDAKTVLDIDRVLVQNDVDMKDIIETQRKK